MKIEPMLLSETWDKSILKDTTKFFQIKENGIRSLIHVKEGKIVGIRNRSNNPILYCFPEFKNVKFNFSTGILDCEICVFKSDRSVFYSGIDKRRSAPSEKVLREYPATIVVFDALFLDENLVMKPYKYRYDKIQTIEVNEEVVEGDFVRIANNFDGEDLWVIVKNENLEGVVIKNPNTMYEVGKRSKEQLKLKNYKVIEVEVTATEPNSKGTKIFSTVEVDGGVVDVEAQLAGIFDVEVGTKHFVKYLDIVGNRMIQPTKVRREQMEV